MESVRQGESSAAVAANEIKSGRSMSDIGRGSIENERDHDDRAPDGGAAVDRALTLDNSTRAR